MTNELVLLLFTAASLGFLHTLFGPDHYLPFIVMSKARNWSTAKTAWVTILCGLGHVGSSILLGVVGIIFGLGLSRLEIFDSTRGDLAAWLFIVFGLVYFIYGIRKSFRGHTHTHTHAHVNGTAHEHEHQHHNSHVHVHAEKKNITPWVLFTIFVLGPCEPLIPVLMYPAAKHSSWGVAGVAIVFSLVTLVTMLATVFLGLKGVKLISTSKLERHMHAIAGATICLSGVAIVFLGL
jgi:nickel/cobalt transporter (NicO) family protein